MKNDQIEVLEKAVNAYKSKVALIKQTQRNLYEEYAQEKKGWQQQQQSLQEKHDRMQELHEQSQIKLQEFDVVSSPLLI